MEQHPVPRNISSFQFHLIGDMTLRQFGYLAGGAAVAYIIIKIAPFPGIISVPIAITVFLIGFAFAFLPIQERPLDRWLMAFMKSILSPTQFLWHKDNWPPDVLLHPAVIHVAPLHAAPIEAHRDARQKLENYLASTVTQPHEMLNIHEKRYVDQTLSLFSTLSDDTLSNTPPKTQSSSPQIIHAPAAAPVIIPPAQKITQPTVQPPPEQQHAKSIPLPKPIQHLQPEKPTITPLAPPPQKTGAEYETLKKQLDILAQQKEDLQKELARLSKEFSSMTATSTVVRPIEAEAPKQPTVLSMPNQATARSAGIATLPTVPNMVMGAVHDAGKRILPNIIVTIKDGKGTPLRALKTNKLGQFEIATPLPNGVYLIELEDPMKRYIFDTAEITLSGRAYPPLEIIAKGEKEMLREKLSRELFGSAAINANI
jgi:hypothetical protein